MFSLKNYIDVYFESTYFHASYQEGEMRSTLYIYICVTRRFELSQRMALYKYLLLLLVLTKRQQNWIIGQDETALPRLPYSENIKLAIKLFCFHDLRIMF